MKPFPSQGNHGDRPDEPQVLPLSMPMLTSSERYSTSNRRVGNCGVSRAYPWLMVLSTAVAALFCILYITKPVIAPEPAMIAPGGSLPAVMPEQSREQAIGESSASLSEPADEKSAGQIAEAVQPVAGDPREVIATPSSGSAFEETNLRIQHILTAEAPGGQLDRIVLDVPVLYQSRGLRWTAAEVAEARMLLARLMDYQEQSRALRSEALVLLDSWNSLVERSIPATELRADSPSLPFNQQDASSAPRPAAFLSTEAIQIKPPTQ